MACCKENTVTLKQVFTLELNMQEKKYAILYGKGLYPSPCILILSDLFHYTVMSQGKLSSQVNMFLNSLPLEEYLITDLQHHRIFF